MRTLIFILLAVFCFSFAQAQEVRDTVVVNDDWRYEGQWPEGQGVLYEYGDGLYIGSFKEGRPEGLCYYISIYQNTKYYGDFKNGKRHGFGSLARPAGFYYEGAFEDGYPHGEGTMYYPDNFYFKGTFNIGKPNIGADFYVRSKEEMSALLPVICEPVLTKDQQQWLKKQKSLVSKSNKSKRKKTNEEEEDVEKPMFAGGDPHTFSKWVNPRLIYPIDARSAGIEGTVLLRFTILANGELADPHVIKSSGNPSIDCEALRVVCQSPLWTPGKKEGKHIPFSFSFPVIFLLR